MSTYGIGGVLASAVVNRHSITWSPCLDYGSCRNTNITYHYDPTLGDLTYMPLDTNAFPAISAAADIAAVESEICVALGSTACSAETAVVNLCWEGFWLFSGMYGSRAVTTWNEVFGSNDECNNAATTSTMSVALSTANTASTATNTETYMPMTTGLVTASDAETYTLTNTITESGSIVETITLTTTDFSEPVPVRTAENPGSTSTSSTLLSNSSRASLGKSSTSRTSSSLTDMAATIMSTTTNGSTTGSATITLAPFTVTSTSSIPAAPVKSAVSTSTRDPYYMDGSPFIWNWPSSSSSTHYKQPSSALLAITLALSLILAVVDSG